MDPKYITINKENIDSEHICCVFSDKKCKDGYQMKKAWLKNEFDNGYVFRRLDVRAKVFIEYVPAESAWIPVDAPNYLMINCFWVSGKYKGQGHAKALLQSAINDAKAQSKAGLVTVAGIKKFHFMSDMKWLLTQGFKIVETLPDGFALLALKLDEIALNPSFKECVKNGECNEKNGLVVYYTNRCPFTDYYVNGSLWVMAQQKNIPLKVIRLESMAESQAVPTPATIFSAFYNGLLLTTDMSICTESGFAKYLKLDQ